jgi:hypothetical protein
MQVTFLVIYIGEPDYAKYTLPFIKKYCNKYNYDLILHREETYKNIHPSWYKMKCHTLYNAGFILCCDLDIIPMPDAPPIHEHLNFNVINMCRDADRRIYNCGLIGIPRKLRHIPELVYDIFVRPIQRDFPCWEQFPFNRVINKKNIKVNKLDSKWNWITCNDKNIMNPVNTLPYFKHLTDCGVAPPTARLACAKAHYQYYFYRKYML